MGRDDLRLLVGVCFQVCRKCCQRLHNRQQPQKESCVMAGLKASVKDNVLLIQIPLNAPRESASGKTFVVASSQGNVQTELMIGGKPVIIGLNAYVRK